MLKAGAPTGCKPGAADAAVPNKTYGEESRNAPAPGATSPSRSVGAPAPGADAPGFSSLWGLRRSVVRLSERAIAHIYVD